MSEYKIREEDIHIIRASKQSESRKDLFNHELRRVEKGWMIYYEHYNVDQGIIKSEKVYLPDEVVDILTTYHAKDKLSK